MNKVWKQVCCLILAAVLLAGCGAASQQADGAAKLEEILQRVSFDTELSEVGSNAVLYFPDLPQGSTIRMFTGSGYYADEAVLLTVPGKSDAKKAMKVVQRHLDELRDQFRNYVPEEVGKIEDAVTAQFGNQILLCITEDTQTVRQILEETGVSSVEDADPSVQTDGTENTRETVPASAAPYPTRSSQSGTFHDYGNGVIRVDNAAYELYTFTEGTADAYASVINTVAEALKGQTTVYDIAIPTGAIMIPDDIANQLSSQSNQGEAIEKIFSKLSAEVVQVNPYDNLMRHRNEYLYFHTDYHWNGRGAYYAYEAFCNAKGVTPYRLEERREQRFGNFLGALYVNHSGKDSALQSNPDTVEAFHPHSPNATMRYTDQKGNTYDWNIIMDVSDWNSSSKYSTFAAADNPIAVFENPSVTDGSVAVVVKESYGNALMPYLVDHYSTIYELDYRYWEGNLLDFVREKKADDLIFANNLSMIGSSLLIGKLANVTN